MVVVTGMGAVSALGTGIDAHRAALWEGRDGIRTIERFETAGLASHLGAMWPGWDGLVQTTAKEAEDLVASVAPFPVHELALIAAREAWSSAGVRDVDPRRAAIVFGTCYGQTYVEFSAVTERIANALDLAGPRVTVSTACASSTNAIGLARDLLLRGHADVVIAGGADALLREPFAGFSSLGVLSAEKCAPFSDPPGTTLGEGAGFVVLEREADASKRNANVWTRVFGYGLSADGHHETTPDPSGDGLRRAMRWALADAGWDARAIDYVSAHATGTHNNDRIEHSVIARELASALVSGSKGHIGHVQGAAGVLELILAVICHREGCVPPTLHFRGARPGCATDPIASSTPREAHVERALKLSAAFGGANAVLAYGADVATKKEPIAPARVVITGHGVVGPNGALRTTDLLALDGSKKLVGACRGVDLDALGVDGRRLDRSSRWLTAAAAIARRKRAPAESTGLFVAATRMPTESSMRCTESIRQRGAIGTSASAFARMSVNAPAGACSRALGLLGPTSTLSIDDGSGLLAIALAAEWLSVRDDATAILAGAVDEPCGRYEEETEGAACVALERASDPRAGEIAVASWGIAGRDGARDAIARAMSGRTGVDGVFVDGSLPDAREWLAPNAPLGVTLAQSFWGTAHATRSCAMAAAAIARLEAGHGESALLVATRGASSVAVVIERTRPR
jgi:3-oxoacyl-[acyl-carrier-protein] synthase II